MDDTHYESLRTKLLKFGYPKNNMNYMTQTLGEAVENAMEYACGCINSSKAMDRGWNPDLMVNSSDSYVVEYYADPVTYIIAVSDFGDKFELPEDPTNDEIDALSRGLGIPFTRKLNRRIELICHEGINSLLAYGFILKPGYKQVADKENPIISDGSCITGVDYRTLFQENSSENL